MAFFVGYSENIWSDERKDVEAMYASELIYMVKELSLVWSWCINNWVLFQSCKIFGQVNTLTALRLWGQIRVCIRS